MVSAVKTKAIVEEESFLGPPLSGADAVRQSGPSVFSILPSRNDSRWLERESLVEYIETLCFKSQTSKKV